MRWWVFAIFAAVFLVLEFSVQTVFEIRSLGSIAPSFVAILVVFISLFAPRLTALWACWGLGLLVDLFLDLDHGSLGLGPLLGAHALGYSFGCYLLLQVRAMLFRNRALTIGVMTVLFVIAMSLVVIFIYTVHGWYPHEEFSWRGSRPTGELLERLGIALYSGLLALPIGYFLVWTMPLWSFRPNLQRRAVWR